MNDDAGPDGAPILLVHGLVISSLYWMPLIGCLAGVARVYAPDLPGFGRSESPRETLDVRGLARALARWHASMGLGPCHVIGNSLGCQTASEFAANEPDSVLSLTLIGPTADPTAPTLLQHAWRLFRETPHGPWQLFFNEVVDLARCGVPRGWRTANAMLAHRLDLLSPRIPVPALVCHGVNDAIVPEAWLHRIAAGLAYGEVLTLQGAAHCVHYTHPELTARTVLDFMHRSPRLAHAPAA